jgi:hypothetical protein
MTITRSRQEVSLKESKYPDCKREFDIGSFFMAGPFVFSPPAPSARSHPFGAQPRFGPIVRGAFQDAADGFNENFNYPIRGAFSGPADETQNRLRKSPLPLRKSHRSNACSGFEIG